MKIDHKNLKNLIFNHLKYILIQMIQMIEMMKH